MSNKKDSYICIGKEYNHVDYLPPGITFDDLSSFFLPNNAKTPFSGVFWIINIDKFIYNMPYIFRIATSKEGDIEINTLKYQLNSKKGNTYNHKKLWEELPSKLKKNKSFDYYPRGRVMISNKKATIYLHPSLLTERIMNFLIYEFNLKPSMGIEEICFKPDFSNHYNAKIYN